MCDSVVAFFGVLLLGMPQKCLKKGKSAMAIVIIVTGVNFWAKKSIKYARSGGFGWIGVLKMKIFFTFFYFFSLFS